MAVSSEESDIEFKTLLESLNIVNFPKHPEELGIDLDHRMLGPALWHKFKEASKQAYGAKWKRCNTSSKIIQDITWEQLNTGHWKDVNITWRHFYTYACLFKCLSEYALYQCGDSSMDLMTAVKTCDIGLLMGAPVMDNILNKVVRGLQRQYTASFTKKSETDADHPKKLSSDKSVNTPDISPNHSVVRLKCPSLEYFKKHYVDTATPAILENCIDHWPSMTTRKWDIEYLRSVAGCRTVPIEIGSMYTEDDWTQSLMTIDAFIEKFITGPTAAGDKGYLAQHQLFDQIPELQKDIIIPEYCCLGEKEEVDINAWFGPCGTVSPLHQDPKHNLLAQVVGTKYIKLYSTKYTANVYPHEGHLLSNTSQVDAENPDYEKFPLLKEASHLECILREGELLYIPPKYWHYVRSLALSFSVSFWWE